MELVSTVEDANIKKVVAFLATELEIGKLLHGSWNELHSPAKVLALLGQLQGPLS